MVLLDTNVLSEVMRPSPDKAALRWLDAQPSADVWISAVTVAEIKLGLALLPEGHRRQALTERVEAMLREDFSEACLPFDAAAAVEYASLVAHRTRTGRPISVEDAQIAAIALVAGLTLATRNTKDFLDIEGLTVVNPWEWTA